MTLVCEHAAVSIKNLDNQAKISESDGLGGSSHSPMSNVKLIVTDIDNTVFDWVSYYVRAVEGLIEFLAHQSGIEKNILFEEARSVFGAQGSIEYPFLVQQLPSILKQFGNSREQLLGVVVSGARNAFRIAAQDWLRPYPGVEETLKQIRVSLPGVPIAALTDAPRYVAMWKLDKLGVLSYFDAIYGLPDPRIPTDVERRWVLVDDEILFKHLNPSDFGFTGNVRVLPGNYEKPGDFGLRTVLMDYRIDSKEDRSDVIWIGDNLRKDVGLGQSLGVSTAWARYGASPGQDLLDRLALFSPKENQEKNVNLAPVEGQSLADFVLDEFADVLKVLGIGSGEK